jgi:hypothetical protein
MLRLYLRIHFWKNQTSVTLNLTINSQELNLNMQIVSTIYKNRRGVVGKLKRLIPFNQFQAVVSRDTYLHTLKNWWSPTNIYCRIPTLIGTRQIDCRELSIL